VVALLVALFLVRRAVPACDDHGCAGDTLVRAPDGMTMVYVPGRTFQMGSTDDEVDYVLRLCERHRAHCQRKWFEDEQPPHRVTLDGFWIDRTEVTNGQFAAFLNARGNQGEGRIPWLDLEDGECLIERVGEGYRPRDGYADHPVVEVTWYGARAYCEWVGGRLPTEAEWEYAARGPGGNPYPWGDALPDGSRLNFCDVNCGIESLREAGYDDGYAHTAPVGSYEEGASWCGALDMAGNVWEWVADWYGVYPATDQTNPTGPETWSSRAYRVVRGGSWAVGREGVHAAVRVGLGPGYADPTIGFRCVRAATEG